MAQAPYFVLSPNAILSAIGLLRGPDPTVPTPPEDWRMARVDVVIPALNEERNIVLCLASVARQTLRPRRVLLIDDGSTDNTARYAEHFCALNGLALTVIRRKAAIGKTPTIKRQAHELDSDVEFILDADTVLESPEYLERTVQKLYEAGGIASACGTILPLRERDRQALLDHDVMRSFRTAVPRASLWRRPEGGRLARAARVVTQHYRDALYMFLQRFVYHGQMVWFGTISNPIGCAVAYRRKYVKAVFDEVSPSLGDDLTNSEDIFIGLALLAQGYRNIQVPDVYARTMEPEVHRLPRQLYMWSSAFLQSCYYFDALVRSPFKAVRRYRQRQQARRMSPRPVSQLAVAGSGSLAFQLQGSVPGMALREAATAARTAPALAVPIGSAPDSAPEARPLTRHSSDRRRIREPYRQPFGYAWTEQYGRPAGWILLMSGLEKIGFPTAIVIMLVLGMWEALAITILAETTVVLAALAIVTKGQRMAYVAKGVLTTPIRYGAIACDLFTIGRFTADLWISGDRRWRK
jgi:glycosyltransferase involved in cell wall biosynthesis